MEELLVLTMVIPIVALIGGLVIGAMVLSHRARLKELAYRERIAMIERGLVPAPESDPAGFERATSISAVSSSERAIRHRTAGIAFLGIGLALMLIIGFAGGAPGPALGIGGATMILGAAGIANSILIAQDEARRTLEAPRRPPTAPPGGPDDQRAGNPSA